jgi:hypothetical protein
MNSRNGANLVLAFRFAGALAFGQKKLLRWPNSRSNMNANEHWFVPFVSEPELELKHSKILNTRARG